MYRDYYSGRARGGAQRYRDRQSGVLHALDLCGAARNHGSADDRRERHADRRATDRGGWRRRPAAADSAGSREATFRRTRAGGILRRRVVAILLFLTTCGAGIAAEPFPFDRELMLDAAPMRPGKRMPILTVEPNGNARIDLWCRAVSARVEIADASMKIEADPLPQELPAMQSAGQCTPERIKADEEMLADLAQVTGWRRDDEAIVLVGT